MAAAAGFRAGPLGWRWLWHASCPARTGASFASSLRTPTPTFSGLGERLQQREVQLAAFRRSLAVTRDRRGLKLPTMAHGAGQGHQPRRMGSLEQEWPF